MWTRVTQRLGTPLTVALIAGLTLIGGSLAADRWEPVVGATVEGAGYDVAAVETEDGDGHADDAAIDSATADCSPSTAWRPPPWRSS